MNTYNSNHKHDKKRSSVTHKRNRSHTAKAKSLKGKTALISTKKSKCKEKYERNQSYVFDDSSMEYSIAVKNTKKRTKLRELNPSTDQVLVIGNPILQQEARKVQQKLIKKNEKYIQAAARATTARFEEKMITEAAKSLNISKTKYKKYFSEQPLTPELKYTSDTVGASSFGMSWGKSMSPHIHPKPEQFKFEGGANNTAAAVNLPVIYNNTQRSFGVDTTSWTSQQRRANEIESKRKDFLSAKSNNTYDQQGKLRSTKIATERQLKRGWVCEGLSATHIPPIVCEEGTSPMYLAKLLKESESMPSHLMEEYIRQFATAAVEYAAESVQINEAVRADLMLDINSLFSRAQRPPRYVRPTNPDWAPPVEEFAPSEEEVERMQRAFVRLIRGHEPVDDSGRREWSTEEIIFVRNMIKCYFVRDVQEWHTWEEFRNMVSDEELPFLRDFASASRPFVESAARILDLPLTPRHLDWYTTIYLDAAWLDWEDRYELFATQLRNEVGQMRPESGLPVDVNVNEDTQSFMHKIVASIKEIFGAGITIQVDLGIGRFFSDLWNWLKTISEWALVMVQIALEWICARAGEALEWLKKLITIVFPNSPTQAEPDVFSAEWLEQHLENMKPEGLFELPSAFASMCNIKKSISKKDYALLAQELDRLERKKLTGKTFEWIYSIFRTIVNWFSSYFGYELPEYLPTGDKKVDALIERYTHLRKHFREGTMGTFDIASKVFMLQAEIEEIALKQRSTLTPEIREKVTMLLSSFRNLVAYYENCFNPNNGPRIEPPGLLIAGPTEVGKSTNTMPIVLEVTSQVIADEDEEAFLNNHNDFIYFRRSGNEHWDGHTPKVKTIVFDDYGQQVDSIGNPNRDAIETIMLINSVPYHLLFAGLEDKKRHYANPEFVMATTNLRTLKFPSMVEPAAIRRRWKFSFVQVPKHEYARYIGHDHTDPWSRRLDLDKIFADYPYDPKDPMTYASSEVVEYIEWDFDTGKPKTGGRILSYRELVDEVILYYHKNKAKGQAMLDHHLAVKQLAMARRKKVQAEVELQPEGLSESSDSSVEDSGWINYIRDTFNNLAPMYFQDPPMQEAEQVEVETPTLWSKAKDQYVALASFFRSFDLQLGNLEFLTRPFARVPLQASMIKILKACGAILIPVGAILGAYKAVQYMFGEQPQGTYTPSKSGVVQNRIKGFHKLNARSNRPMQKIESGATQDVSFLVKILKRNAYSLAFSDMDTPFGMAIFLSATVFIMPAHFACADRWEPSATLEFRYPHTGNTAFGVSISSMDVSWWDEETDLIAFNLPTGACRPHADITKHFIPVDTPLENLKLDVQIPTLRSGSWMIHYVKAHFPSEPEVYGEGDVTFTCMPVRYSIASMAGDCGAPIVCTDARFGTPVIVGFHVAGSAASRIGMKNCMGYRLNSKIVSEIVEDLNAWPRITEEIQVDDSPLVVEGFVPISHQPEKTVAKPVKTNYRRSPLFGKLWEVSKYPSRLTPFHKDGQLIVPADVARANYARPEQAVDLEALNFGIDFAVHKVLPSHVDGNNRQTYSFEEAVYGIIGEDYADAINMNTSVGAPNIYDKSLPAKKRPYFYDIETDQPTPDSPLARRVRSEVEEIISKAKQGIRMEHHWIDHLKDELRDQAKNDLGKTRAFSCGGMQFTIAFKMLFGPFIQHCFRNKFFNGMAIGANAHVDWNDLVKHVRRKPSDKGMDSDYAHYDASILSALLMGVFEVVDTFFFHLPGYTEELMLARQVLWLDIVNSLHNDGDGNIYMYSGSNCSGNLLTTIINCVAQLIMLSAVVRTILLTVVVMSHMSHLEQIRYIDDNMAMMTFGDDGVTMFSTEFQQYLTPKKIAQQLAIMFGMECTSASKGEAEDYLKPIEDCTFLKRAFKWDGSRWRAPLDVEVIRHTLNWEKKSSTEEEMHLRVEAALMELAQHGEQLFNELAPVIVTAYYETYGIPLECHKFKKALNFHLSMDY